MKWYGEIGFNNECVEEEPGYWTHSITKRNFFGDVLNPSWREQQGEKINPDIQVSNKLSIVYDTFILNNLHNIAYVTFGGAKWKVSDVVVDPDRPRLTLSLGSLFVEEIDEE